VTRSLSHPRHGQVYLLLVQEPVNQKGTNCSNIVPLFNAINNPDVLFKEAATANKEEDGSKVNKFFWARLINK
jgi:hypothetical protein